MEDKGKEFKQGEKILEERKEKVLNYFKSRTSWIFYLILGFILLINYWIRISPLSKLKDVVTGGYTLGPDLDPFLFLRYAKEIVENGAIAAIDTMRYVPRGFITTGETKLLPYLIAYFHKILAFFGSTPSVEYSAALFPVIISIFTAIAFFLLVRRIFKDKGEKSSNIIALTSTLFLVVLPSLLMRTIAGIPEKESVGFFFLFLTFYLFVVAWQSEKLRNSIIFGILAGFSTACMGLIWGGVIYAFTTIAVVIGIAFIFNKIGKREFFICLSWLLFTTLILVSSGKYSLNSLITSLSSGLSFIIVFVIIIDFLLFQTKLKESSFVKKIQSFNLPDRVSSIVVAIIIGIILTTIIIGPTFVFGFTGDLIGHLTTPYTDRLSFTVAENRQPFFSGEWAGSFGPSVGGIPLFFWLFFIGSIFLFHELVNNFEKKNKTILVGSYVIFVSALIFSKYSSTFLNGNSFMSKFFYFGGMIIFAGSFLYVYYKCFKDNNFEELKNTNFAYLLLFAYFIISLVAARSAVRLIMGLAPVAGVMASYFAFTRIKVALEKKEDTMKAISFIVMIIVVIATFWVVYSNYNDSKNVAASYVPSRYNIQWQEAMGWVRNNTPTEAIFSHWWDYGYWVQTIGERATVLDGGNVMPYWDHLMGRHVLTAESEAEALEFMYTHNSTYLLIDPTEIGKYGAYSSIGSNESYDKYSWIGTLILDTKNIQEKRNETVYVYQNGIPLDEDYIYQDPVSGQKILFGARNSYVGALILTKDNLKNAYRQPEVVFVNKNGQQARVPLRYLYYDNKQHDYQTGYKGTMYLLQKLEVNSQQQASLINNGAAMFLSERNMRALWVRLYILGESTNFKLVHSQTNPVVQALKAQGYDVKDFIYFGDVEGPIKIWEASFPRGTKANPDYLLVDYPNKKLEQATLT